MNMESNSVVSEINTNNNCLFCNKQLNICILRWSLGIFGIIILIILIPIFLSVYGDGNYTITK